MSLPEDLRQGVEALVAASGMKGAGARELRDDLERHVRDALEHGKNPGEILDGLGLPAEVAPVLIRSARPRTRRPDPEGGESALRAFGTDLRYGLRTLRRSPTLAVTASAVLALGIAANTVVFTAVDELLLSPLPVRDQASLVDIWPDVRGGNSFLGFGWRDFETYRDAAAPLEAVAAFTGTRTTLGEGVGARNVVAQLVSPEYLPMLGLSPSLGSLEMPTEGFGSELTAVLSHGLWEERFGADPGVIGRSLRLDGRPVTVVGVGPEDFRGHFIGFPVDLWLPLTAADPLLPGFEPDDRSRMPFEMIGRLRPGATPDAAQAALNLVAARLEGEQPETHRGRRVGVTPTTGVDRSLREPVLGFMAILTAVSMLVLVIACLNVGSLLLVRTLSREREIAVRRALGAGSGRLVRQLLAEALVLAAVGTGGGVLLAVLMNDRLAGLLQSLTAGLGLDLRLDAPALALTALAAGVAAVASAAVPALHLLRKAPGSALGARGFGAGAGRTRTALVVGQVAVSVALVVATGLFARALVDGQRADPGFDPDGVASFALDLAAESQASPTSEGRAPPAGGGEGAVPDGGSAFGTLQRVLDDLASIPGVEGATVADAPPAGVARSPLDIRLPGLEPPPGRDGWVVDARRVGAGYLSTMGVPLMAGRDFDRAEAREGPPSAVVSEAFVERFWPGGPAVGRSLEVRGQSIRVVGVARDIRYLVQDPDPDPFVYLSLAGDVPPVTRVTLRAPSPGTLSGEVRRIVAAHLPDQPPPVLSTPRQVMNAALLPQRLGASVVGAMGLAALLLAAVGLYGLVQYTVQRDRHELAVRLALGGRRSSLLRVVLRKGFLLVAAGSLLGLGLAALGAPALSGFLGNVSPRDPATYLAVAVTYAAVGILASWLPARRAARIRPAEALRVE